MKQMLLESGEQEWRSAIPERREKMRHPYNDHSLLSGKFLGPKQSEVDNKEAGDL
jgi:hypothetical protein